MISEFDIDEVEQICIWRLTGIFSADAMMAGYERRAALPGFTYGMGTLADIRGLEFDARGRPEIAEYARRAGAEQSRSGRFEFQTAIVVSPDYNRELAAFFTSIAPLHMASRSRVFEDLDAAKNWLISQRVGGVAGAGS